MSSPEATPAPGASVSRHRGGLLGGLVRGVRPGQWTKNLLVFAAPVAAGAITEWWAARDSSLAFVAFCAAAGGTYLLNDARDVEADRRHPRKQHRPVASGQVPVPVAYLVGAALIVAALIVGFIVTTPLGITVAAYLALTTAYSFGLKHLPVVELVAVAAGFVLRAVAGAAATSLPLSEWFFIVTSAGALLVITAKREAELAHHRSDTDPTERPTRRVLAAYTTGFLTSVRTIAAGLMLVAYCLWAFEGPTGSLPSANGSSIWLQASIVPFAVVVLRYVLLADAGGGERPERLLVTDPVLVTSGILWAIIYGYGTYIA